MKAFIFTYGTSSSFPFHGGWTQVNALNRGEAIAAFRAVHPDVNEGLLNCCSVYTIDEFVKTSMFKNGNLGSQCHEVITLSVEVGS